MAKILIVDDSESLRKKLRSVLESNTHKVWEAENGVEGLDFLAKNSAIDLIVLDINMPLMDGITMCEKIHGIVELQSVPIIMLTTEAKPELKEKAKQLGVRAWVTKPFVPEKFLIGITKLLAKGPPLQPPKQPNGHE
jgi:two-component system, chemotaxis family, chemotaxis protein CheY